MTKQDYFREEMKKIIIDGEEVEDICEQCKLNLHDCTCDEDGRSPVEESRYEDRDHDEWKHEAAAAQRLK